MKAGKSCDGMHISLGSANYSKTILQLDSCYTLKHNVWLMCQETGDKIACMYGVSYYNILQVGCHDKLQKANAALWEAY